MGFASYFEDILDRYCENSLASVSVRRRKKRGRHKSPGRIERDTALHGS